MAKFSDLLKSGTTLGIAIGVGATVVAASVIPKLPAIARAARPVVRKAVKSGLLFAEKGREVAAEVKEELEDIFAEVTAELKEKTGEAQPESPAQAQGSNSDEAA